MLAPIIMLALLQTAPMAQSETNSTAVPLQGKVTINAHWQGKPFSLRQFMRSHFNIGSLFGGPASPRQTGMAIKVCISAPGSMDCGVYQSEPNRGEALPLNLTLPAGDYDVQVWPVSFKPQAQTQNTHVNADGSTALAYTFQWPKGLR